MSSSISNMMSGDSSKANGQFQSTKGTMKETIGNAVGSDSMSRNGKKEHAEGEAETTAAKAQGYVKATADRVMGYGQSVMGSMTGDSSEEMAGNVKNEKAKAEQEMNK
ncbi:related to mismatch base pair and cruciform DNA recognition protein Hmp1 [Armillaria ostoyae]|uniref:Related to mismatch base pair and cruciform DNA recognition protein Hmp1 n=2 Tax=Armillaria TaxID=47424 RepID=A0A284S9P0_ARMOS|nr:hypothetical protein ARMSODRAFT_966357 [Armillaria solidipes]SJL17696.1 related to mismatch base pair and cruciform DNA recognition protein Hmp1 [Armillaria ostoyae]